MNSSLINYMQSQGAQSTNPDPQMNGMQSAQQEPFNPFDQGIKKAIESARESLGMTDKQQEKAMRRSMLSFANNMSQQPREKGFLNNFGSVARSLAPAIIEHDDAEEGYVNQNNKLANQILAYRSQQEDKERQNEEQAWKRQMEERKLGEQIRYHNNMFSNFQTNRANKPNNENDIIEIAGMRFRKLDNIGVRHAEEDKKVLSAAKFAYDNAKKAWDQLQNQTKDDIFRPIGGAFSNKANLVKDQIGLFGKEDYAEETGLRNAVEAQLMNFNLMLEQAKTGKGLTQGMYDRVKANFPDFKNDSLATIKKKMQYITHETDIFAKAANLSVEYGINITPTELQQIENLEKKKNNSNQVSEIENLEKKANNSNQVSEIENSNESVNMDDSEGNIDQIPSSEKDNAPSNLEVAAKSIGSGLLSNLDIPQTVATLAEEYGLNPEYGVYGQGRKLYNKFKGNKHIPLTGPTNLQKLEPNIASNAIKSGLKKHADIDLEVEPVNGTQRLIKHAGEFAGSLGPIGLASKANKVSKTVKAAGLGGAIGGISGVAQELGVDPVVADIGTSLALPLLPAASKNLFNKFTPSHNKNKATQKVADALRAQIGEENIPEVLENIQKHKRQKKPINIQPTTTELAQNVGLSRLYRTQTNNDLIPLRYKENDIKLRQALANIGNTGLEESIKGEAIRMPFFEKFNNKKARRNRLTAPLYEELESIQSGLAPNSAKALLEKEINVSSPGNIAPLEKYLKGLSRNGSGALNLKKIKALEKDLHGIEVQYKDLNPQAIAQIKAPLLKELEEVKTSIYPRPIQIENTIQELGDKVNSLNRSGESNAARKYSGIKKAYEDDLRKHPIGLKHREEYKRLSKPINEIETSSLLNNLVKENKDVSKLEGFVVPSEKISKLVLGADLPNTKILINKAKGNKDLLPLIKGTYIDELLNKSILSNGNFSYDKANKFLNNKYNKEKINIVFNNKEKKKLDYFLNTLEKRNKVETQGKVSGSDTHQKLKVESEFNDSINGIGKLAKDAAIKASGSGSIGRLLTDTLLTIGKKIKNNKYEGILADALVNPNTLKKLMTNKFDKPKTFKDFYEPKVPLGGVLQGVRNYYNEE